MWSGRVSAHHPLCISHKHKAQTETHTLTYRDTAYNKISEKGCAIPEVFKMIDIFLKMSKTTQPIQHCPNYSLKLSENLIILTLKKISIKLLFLQHSRIRVGYFPFLTPAISLSPLLTETHTHALTRIWGMLCPCRSEKKSSVCVCVCDWSCPAALGCEMMSR